MFTKFLYVLIILSVMTTSMYADFMDNVSTLLKAGDYAEALNLAELACENGDTRGCGLVGGMYRDGQAVAKNSTKAIKFLNKACELKNEYGCYAVGSMYESGEGTKINFDKAKVFYQKACDMDSADGCVALGFLYTEGKGVKKSFKKGNPFFEKSCNLNHGSASGMGCFWMGSVYKVNNMGVKANSLKTLQYYNKACNDLSFGHACFALGDLYANGKDIVKINYKTALHYFKQGCEVGDEDSCAVYNNNSR